MKSFLQNTAIAAILCVCGNATLEAQQYTPPTPKPDYTFFNDGTGVYLEPGAILYIGNDDNNDSEGGDMVIRDYLNAPDQGKGFIKNDGLIMVTGDWISGENVDDGQSTKDYGNPKFTVNDESHLDPILEAKRDRMVLFVDNPYYDNDQYIYGHMNQPEASFYNLAVDKNNANQALILGADVRVSGSLVWSPSSAHSGGAAATFDADEASSMTELTGNQGYSSTAFGKIKTYLGNVSSGQDYELYVANDAPNAIVNYTTMIPFGANVNKVVEVRGVPGVGVGGLAREIGELGKDYDFPIASIGKTNNSVRLNFSNLPDEGNNPGERKVRALFVDVSGQVGTVNYQHYVSNYSCNSNNPQWFIFDQFVADHGYWSFDAANNNQQKYKYTMRVFPNGVSATDQSLITTGNNTRVLKYSAAVTEDLTAPQHAGDDWSADAGGIGSVDNNLIDYTLFDNASAACNNNGSYLNGIPGGVYQDFSHFQIGTNSSNALPIELLSLTAYPVNNEYIRVAWTTATEINNDKFEVLRSEDGINFSKIGEVKGNGTSTDAHNYLFNDKDVAANVIYYYRLNQIDFDGTATLTHIVSASLNAADNIVISDFIPNPARNASKLLITSPVDMQLRVTMYDALGQQIESSLVNLPAGVQTPFIVDASLLAAGNYMVSLKNELLFASRRLVVTTY